MDLPLVTDLEGLPVITSAIAFFAMDVYVGEEVHFDSRACRRRFADVAAAAFYIEGKNDRHYSREFSLPVWRQKGCVCR